MITREQNPNETTNRYDKDMNMLNYREKKISDYKGQENSRQKKIHKMTTKKSTKLEKRRQSYQKKQK